MPPLSFVSWLIPWEPSVTVTLASVLAAMFYLRGAAACRPSAPRQLCFWLGLASLYAVSHTAFDYYAEHAFFMHRLQHSVLHHAGPFLLALAQPGAALAAGMPAAWRRGLRVVMRQPSVRYAVDALNRPFAAAGLFCGLIALWLIPSVHFIAMLDWRLYRVMNWGMAINGLMFWNLALNNYALRPAQLSPGQRISLMLAVIPPQIAIGMLVFLAPHELYSIYSLCGRAFADISPMDDQQMGGLILWIPAAMTSVLGVLVVMAKEWMPRTSF